MKCWLAVSKCSAYLQPHNHTFLMWFSPDYLKLLTLLWLLGVLHISASPVKMASFFYGNTRAWFTDTALDILLYYHQMLFETKKNAVRILRLLSIYATNKYWCPFSNLKTAKLDTWPGTLRHGHLWDLALVLAALKQPIITHKDNLEDLQGHAVFSITLT